MGKDENLMGLTAGLNILRRGWEGEGMWTKTRDPRK